MDQLQPVETFTSTKKGEIAGDECAFGKIDNSRNVRVDGNAYTGQEFKSGEHAWVVGDVTSVGSIKTDPKDWSKSIGGTASANSPVQNGACEDVYGVCLFSNTFVPIQAFTQTQNVNETSGLKKRPLVRQQDIHVKNGKKYTWAPGTYGKVVFDYKSEIHISSGVYYVDHLEIHKRVTFKFADLSGGCGAESNGLVYFAAARSIDIERDFKMDGVNFGSDGDSACSGTYGILWTSLANISIKGTDHEIYGAFIANQHIDIDRSNTIYGCLGGQTGVELESRVTLNQMGPIGCNCGSNLEKN